MRVTALEIRNLRVFANICLEPASGVNWIIGTNGSGKTTLLESIFLLARGRSFRNLRQGPLASVGASHFRVSGRLVAGGLSSRLDLKAVEGRKKLYLNGDLVTKVRDLRGCMQVRILTENSQKLLEDQPALRRLFLDWNLFHVEHGYADLLERFRRTLSQRNAWLRKGGPGKPIWDGEYVDLANSITNSRRKFVADLQAELHFVHATSPVLPKVYTSFRRGWAIDRDLKDVLSEGKNDDLRRGYTRFGPSRADLAVRINGIQAIGSRGQSKLVVALLQHAAQSVCANNGGTDTCIWLLDDLEAEMDRENFEQIWRLFERSKHQIFISSHVYPDESRASSGSRKVEMFHVEHGVLHARRP